MSKVHIALIGGQTMPVYVGMREIDAEKVVLVHSRQSVEDAERVKKDFPTVEELVRFDPLDYDLIQKDAMGLLERFTNDEVTVNVSSGTKPWAIAFAFLSERYGNVSIIYVDQNSVLYDYTHNEKKNATVEFDIATLLRFNNREYSSCVLLDDYTDDDLKVLNDVKNFRKVNFRDFNKLTILNGKENNKFQNDKTGTLGLMDGSSISWDKNANRIEMVLGNKRREPVRKVFVSPNVMKIVMNTGWFEYEVARLLSGWKHASEIKMNVVFPYNGSLPKNEIDVMLSTGRKLVFVECKTQIFKNTDIDKFSTVVKNYGGLGCKALFVTEGNMKAEAKEKCNDNKIMTFSMKDEFGMLSREQALYMMLDNELFNTNIR